MPARTTALLLVAAAAAAAASPASWDPSTPAPFNSSHVHAFGGYLLRNVNYGGGGGVLASPDANVYQGGSYRFAWQRDGALVNLAVLQTMDASVADPLLDKWAGWVQRTSSQRDPNGIATLFEPKFNLDGSIFSGGWCRPQTDGPGLRARTLSEWAVARGADKMPKGVYDTVRNDLDFLASNYLASGCDAWEEVNTNDFFWNRMTMRHGLLAGAGYADLVADHASAASWRATAQKIEATLGAHDNGQYIQESANRQKDAIVMCALNQGYAGDSVYAPTDASVARTIKVYNELFSSAFPINGADSANNVPGILYGRYEGDKYGGGNPWILTTNCLAELYYRGAAHVASPDTASPSDDDVAAWESLFGYSLDSPRDLAAALAAAGDGVLERVRHHVAGANFHLSEQLDKHTGFECSATDLSWSYATALTALHARGKAVEAFAATFA